MPTGVISTLCPSNHIASHCNQDSWPEVCDRLKAMPHGCYTYFSHGTRMLRPAAPLAKSAAQSAIARHPQVPRSSDLRTLRRATPAPRAFASIDNCSGAIGANTGRRAMNQPESRFRKSGGQYSVRLGRSNVILTACPAARPSSWRARAKEYLNLLSHAGYA
jgi:hypothetical protein